MFLKVEDQQHLTSQNQRGSSLVIAIFIIVVMSLLGATLMRMMSSSAETLAYEVLGTRAYAAAQSGIQWELQQLFPLNAAASACQASPVGGFPNFSNITGLNNCRISLLTCSDFTTADGTRYYIVTSTGQCDLNGEQTSRTVEVQARSVL